MGNGNILNVELIKEGDVIKQFQPNNITGQWEFKFKGTSEPTWYYVRLTMENEHLACSSAIWIN